MEEISKLLRSLGDVWGWIVAAVGVAAAGYRAWRKWSRQVLRALHLSDVLHHHYGNNAGKSLVAEMRQRSKDGAIREVRQQLLENKLRSAIFLCSAAGGSCEFANNQLAELFGLDAEACEGNGWLQAIAPDQRVRVHDHWQECVAKRIPYRCEFTVINQRTGKRTPCVSQAYPAVLTDGALLGFVGVVDPIPILDEAS